MRLVLLPLVAVSVAAALLVDGAPPAGAPVVAGTSVGWEEAAAAEASGDAAAIEYVVAGRQRDVWLWMLELKRQAAEAAARARGSGGGGGTCDRAIDYGTYGPGGYSGDPSLPPGEVVARESNGNYGSCNESSGACGRYQFLDSTWNNYGGYSSACDAPPAVQDQKARETWAGGAGCSHWSAC